MMPEKAAARSGKQAPTAVAGAADSHTGAAMPARQHRL
jgi:hypothetical protein